jgi:hypothetical protein
LSETTPAFLRALGRAAPPAEFQLDGVRYTLGRVFKHDFFAATSLYQSESSKVILKIGRQARLGPLPLSWLGRLMTRYEYTALAKAQDIDGIPRLLGRWGPSGIVREFIDGRPLQRGLPVSDHFHSQLRHIVDQLHARGMAYVDLEKAENVLVGDDGRPYLFDFQIAWHIPRRLGGELPPLCWIRRWLQSGDRYHLRKLHRRTRPDLLSADELAESYRKPWYVRMHAAVAGPLRWLRRRVLNRIDPRRTVGERGRVPEQTYGGL